MKILEAKHKIAICLLLMLTTASLAGAADFNPNDPTMSVILISIVAIVLLVYSYKLRVENIRLGEELNKYKSRFAEYVQSMGGKYEPIKSYEQMGGRSTEEKHEEGKPKEEEVGAKEKYTKRLYWDRLASTISKTTPNNEELTELEDKKKDLQELIELTKKKYHQREIGEKSFDEIIKEQQKQMIEIDGKISKLRKKEETNAN